MKVAIVGLPKSGASTVFSAVTGLAVDQYAAPEPRHAVVRVPDARLEYLVGLYQPKKVTEATIEFVDVPGCAPDDAKGQADWRRLLPVVRQAELIVIVVRDFEAASVPAYRNRVDPKADFATVWDEFVFADLSSVTTRLERLEAALKKPTKTHDLEKREMALLERCREALESDAPVSSVLARPEDRQHLAGFAFLTDKPLVGVRNVSDDRLGCCDAWEAPHARDTVTLSAAIEAEIALLDPADRPAFMADLGLEASARDRLVRTCYHACGLISFLTMGSDEVRAWTIRKGATAVEAAGKVHTDLARGFIRAETVAYDDLVTHKDLRGAKAAGRVRKEGKTYVVQDGDILNILASL